MERHLIHRAVVHWQATQFALRIADASHAIVILRLRNLSRLRALVSASAVKRVLYFLSVCSATHLKMFRQKRNTHKLLHSNPYRNVVKHLWREPPIIKFQKFFPYLDQQATFVNAHFLQCRVSSNTSMRVLQTAIYNLNFIVLLLILSRISQNWFPTASGVLLLVSRIIYLNKCNRLDIIIFRL